MHYFIVFLSLVIISTSFVFAVHAQQSATSNQVITRVGDAPLEQKPGGNFVFYCQADPKWQAQCPGGGSNVMAGAGCGPASMAMIISTLGLTKTPLEMDQIFRGPPQARACGDFASSLGTFINSGWLENNGFESHSVAKSGGRLDLNDAQKYLNPSEGYIILTSSDQFPCPRGGWCDFGSKLDHVFVVDKVDPLNNLMSVRDPVNCRDTNPQEISANIMKLNDFSIFTPFAIRRKR